MNKYRLENLADGVFAIVMTLLVLELRVPSLDVSSTSNTDLYNNLISLGPIFAGYLIGFAVLAVYWISHHFLFSVFAKNIDRNLANLNILFLVFVSLVPFTSHLLGRYAETQLAIGIFGINVIVIGAILYQVRRYVYHSDKIENAIMSKKDIRHSALRIVIPVFFAVLAIPLSFVSASVAIWLFLVPVIFNLIPNSFDWIDSLVIKLGLEKKLETIREV